MTKSAKSHLRKQRASPEAGEDAAALVTAAGQGDQAALEALLMKAQEVAYRFSMMVCGHAHDAEDVMQEALIKTYRHVGRIREPAAFKPWLYRTVRNACLMRRRRRVDEPSTFVSIDELMMPDSRAARVDPVDRGRSPEEFVINRRLRARLTRALSQLPAPYRVVVFLREMEGLSTREVSTVLRISEANVKTRLHRARLFLQQQLEGRS